MLLAIFVFFCLPSRPDRSKYLSEDERTVQLTRLNRDSSLDTKGLGIDWAAVKHAALDWRTYVMAVMYSAMNLGLGSTSGMCCCGADHLRDPGCPRVSIQTS